MAVCVGVALSGQHLLLRLWSLFTVEFGVSHGAELDVSGNIGADVLGAGDDDGRKD